MNDERKTLEQRAQMTDLERLRHSASHVLATAILKIWPEAQFAAGPPVENGFYYDVDLPHRISPDDFEKIEAEMKNEIKANHPFERIEVSRDEALALGTKGRLAALGERSEPSKFKLDIIENIPPDEKISLYRNGDFIDLCAGPHVMRTGNIGAFKLTTVASAYYKGDEKNPQLQRVYGTAFKTKKELDDYFAMLEEAKKRDHRKLGSELELFVFDDDVGPGLANVSAARRSHRRRIGEARERNRVRRRLSTRPHAAHRARKSLQKEWSSPLLRRVDVSADGAQRRNAGFQPVRSAQASSLRVRIWQARCAPRPIRLEAPSYDRYYLKAMNCPHHHKLFAAVPRSYRDLPLRLAEYGTCYRYEKSGELFGLMRVRSLQMNDAHLYMTPEQFEAEFNAVNEMYLNYFKLFGIDKYLMRFSTHDPSKLGQKFVDEPELWKQTEEMMRNVVKNSGINYVEVPNEAAFYGPKIDVQAWSVIGREFSIATNQVDFAQPRNFDLRYKDATTSTRSDLHPSRAAGHARTFHRIFDRALRRQFPALVVSGTGRILTIGDDPKLLDYARSILNELRAHQVRAEIDDSTEKSTAKSSAPSK